MAKRRIVRRKGRNTMATAHRGTAMPVTKESFGLKPGEDCQILVIGGGNYCSFTLARLGRLGIGERIAITNSENHAIWAVKNLSPKIVISSIDYEHRSGGIDLMRKLETLNPQVSVVLTSAALDVSMDERALRDLAWSMSDSWSFVTRRKTDNGDPLGVAVVTAMQGIGWIDYPVRKQLEKWRIANRRNGSEVPVAA